jgi:hypothetical protein
MRVFGLNRRRSEGLLLVIGQLILIAYVFQVAAFDHWGVDVGSDVTGILDTSAHAAVHTDHCHGAPSACADAGGGFVHISPGQAFPLPSQSPSLELPADLAVQAPAEVLVAAMPQPPRASV